MKAGAFALLLLAAGVVALLPWRIFACGLCGGAQVRKQAVNQNRYADETTCCPACRDRGRVSFWALRRGVLDPRLRELLQKAAGELSAPTTVAAFQDLLAASGVKPRFAPASEFAWARFVRTGQGDRVLVCGEHATWTRFSIHLDVHSRQLWLFDLQGRLLDSFAFESRLDVARPHLTIAPEKDVEGTALEIAVMDAGARSRQVSRSLEGLRLWRDGEGDLPPERWFQEGRVRLRFLGGRWVP